ncbi:MAG: polyprenyl synthetase family protein [Cellulomonas sp.]
MNSLTALVDVEDVRAQVDAALALRIAELRGGLARSGGEADRLADAVAVMLSGGKRLRAAFCYWSWRAHGGHRGAPREQVVLEVCAALELFQAAALFHDDVMDDSDTRRGLPAAHRTFADLHVSEEWSGDARRFGESAAILLGDLALVLSEQAFREAISGETKPLRDQAGAVFDLMRTEVTVGQYLDVLAQALPWGHDPAADEARARDVIRAKSARYSVEHPLVLGAVLAEADDHELDACRTIGLPLGEGFQLRDDLLGVFGDPATTGKPAGDDLREGKRTVLVARAMARAQAAGDAGTVAMFRRDLGRRDLDDHAVRALADAIAATGAPADVERLISQLTDGAFAALDRPQLDEPGRTMLGRLAHAAVDRRA